MIELTEEQRRELDQAEPVAVDPQTKKEYVLVSREVYEKLRAILADPDPRDTYAAMDRAFAPLWDEPKMADYDNYEDHER
jgi:hypothetical protein